MEFDFVLLGERIMAPHDFMGMAARMAVGKHLPDEIRLGKILLLGYQNLPGPGQLVVKFGIIHGITSNLTKLYGQLCPVKCLRSAA